MAFAAVEAFAQARVPPGLEHEMAVQAVRKGRAITIVELRPPWRPQDAGAKWTETEIAQLRLDRATNRWTLYSQGADERWRPYGLPSAPGVEPLLAEIEADPTGIFWG